MNVIRKLNETMKFVNEMTQNADWEKDDDGLMWKAVWDFRTLHTKIDAWQHSQAKTFVLSRDLAEAFHYTDIPLDLSPDEFKYPFDSFMIEGETPFFKVEDRPIHHILYINKRVVETSDAVLLQRDGTKAKEIGWDVSLTALAPGASGIGIDQMWVNLRNGSTIEETYKMGSADQDDKYGRDPVNKTETQNLINIFYNTIMYINDPDRRPEKTEVRKSRKMQVGTGKKAKAVRTEYILLTPPANYIPLSGGKGRSIDKRFIVRGHYRKQAYGKQMLLRKKIWILPFWKGPDMAEIASKKYKVK